MVEDISHLSEAEKITLIQQLRERIHELEQETDDLRFIRTIANRISDIVVVSGSTGEVLYSNAAAEEQLGYTAAYWKSRHPQDNVHPNDLSTVAKSLTLSSSKKHAPIQTRHRLRHKDGHYIWFHSVTHRMYDAAGELIFNLTISRNIDHSWREESALLDTEAKLQLIAENISDIVYLFDMNKEVQYVSPSFENITGYSIAEMYRLNFIDYLHPEEPRQIIERWYKVYEGIGFADLEFRIQTRNGETRWLSSTWHPIFDKEGVQVGVVGRELDITQRKQTEQQLAYEQAQTRAMLDGAPYALWTIDRNYRVLQHNRLMVDLMRDVLKVDVAIGDHMLEIVPSERIRRAWRGWYNQAFLGESFSANAYEQDGDETRHFHVSFSPIREADDSINSVVASSQEITAMVANQFALRESRNSYQLLVDNFPSGIVAKYNQDLRLTLVGGQYLRRFRLRKEQVNGQLLADILPHKLNTIFEPLLRNALQGTPQTTNYEFARRFFQIGMLPIHDPATRAIEQGMVVIQDVTEQIRSKEREVQLEVQRERVAMIRNFVTDASHEFKTPLSNINTAAHLLQHTASPEKTQQYYERIITQTSNLQQLIDKLIRTVQVDSGINLQEEPVRLNTLVEYLITNAKSAIQNAQLNLITQFTEDLPRVTGDSRLLMEAFEALLDNAIKFTPAGGQITLRTEASELDVHLIIEDTGIGMDEEDLPHIFDHFFRADPSRTRSGFGMGLVVARAIIERHGGYITVQSKLEKGSHFRITIPQAGTSAIPLNG